MRSYIKVYGPPVMKAIKALEKIAVDEPQVCIMDSLIVNDMAYFTDPDTYTDYAGDYFSPLVPYPIEQERCDKIISKLVKSSVTMTSSSNGSKNQL